MRSCAGGHFRVENAEVRRCGQARILGRYCLHYHKTGYNPPPNSYLKSNSIHHSFQRATTIHGTQHALVTNNVAYRVMGHNYFVEDGELCAFAPPSLSSVRLLHSALPVYLGMPPVTAGPVASTCGVALACTC